MGFIQINNNLSAFDKFSCELKNAFRRNVHFQATDKCIYVTRMRISRNCSVCWLCSVESRLWDDILCLCSFLLPLFSICFDVRRFFVNFLFFQFHFIIRFAAVSTVAIRVSNFRITITERDIFVTQWKMQFLGLELILIRTIKSIQDPNLRQ